MMPGLIGPKVAEFYKPLSDSLQLSLINKHWDEYFLDSVIYNWPKFGKLLRNELKFEITNCWKVFNSEFSNLQYDNFKVIFVEKLLPIFVKSSNSLQKFCYESVSHQHWLGPNVVVLQGFQTEYATTRSETSTVEWILLLTAMLEYGLGNIYYTKTKKNPPHLLRDLLSTGEVLEVFGWEAICFLKILLGTPKAINLRNIVWHGFPEPKQISEHYVAVLILVINSLGHTISVKDLNVELRPQLTQITSCLLKIKHSLPPSKTSVVAMNRAVLACDWLSTAHKTFWRQLLHYKETKEYWKFVILVLPQIELLLRLIYAQANNYDVRAKLDEYYITMDTVFEENLPSSIEKRNMLLQPGAEGLDENCLKLMYDLFVALNGPRIRDKVSHGEVTLECINNTILCDILLQFSYQLLMYKKLQTFGKYASQYHMNSMAWESLEIAKNNLLFLTKLSFLSNFKIFIFDKPKANLQNSMQPESIQIFHRPKKETELMYIVLKIAQLLAQTSINYKSSLSDRYTLYRQHQLHSKRRKTFERMVEALPEICTTIDSILCCLETVYKHLQQDITNEIYSQIKEFERLRRFLKQTMQTAENLLKYSCQERNEWIKTLELCKKFHSSRDSFNFEQSFKEQTK